MRETRLGAILANILSVGTRGLGYFLWYLLRMVYRGEPKLVVAFLAVPLLIVALIWALAR